MTGMTSKTPQERIAQSREKIAGMLDVLATLNATDGDIERACVELSMLHKEFSSKHTVMRSIRSRTNLDIYDQRKEQKTNDGE